MGVPSITKLLLGLLCNKCYCVKGSKVHLRLTGRYACNLQNKGNTHTNINSYTQNFSLRQPALQLQPHPTHVGNMHYRGYPSHGMTDGHDSVTSICLTCHVYTSSCHKSDETCSTAVLRLRSISNAYHDSEKCPFHQWVSETGSIEWGRLHWPLFGESTCTHHLSPAPIVMWCIVFAKWGLQPWWVVWHLLRREQFLLNRDRVGRSDYKYQFFSCLLLLLAVCQ